MAHRLCHVDAASILVAALDLAEADAGALQLRKEPLDLAALIQQMVDLYQPTMAEHRHQLTTELQPVLVEADLSLMNRLIANLLDNEVAHLPAGCCVNILLQARDREAEILIEDNGPGFPLELRDRVFERFVKGKASTGHGLGLAFVDAVAKAHGGSVTVAERAGGGALISLSIPMVEVLREKVVR